MRVFSFRLFLLICFTNIVEPGSCETKVSNRSKNAFVAGIRSGVYLLLLDSQLGPWYTKNVAGCIKTFFVGAGVGGIVGALCNPGRRGHKFMVTLDGGVVGLLASGVLGDALCSKLFGGNPKGDDWDKDFYVSAGFRAAGAIIGMYLAKKIFEKITHKDEVKDQISALVQQSLLDQKNSQKLRQDPITDIDQQNLPLPEESNDEDDDATEDLEETEEVEDSDDADSE